MLSEGGIRVPFIATWPGKLPAGKTYNHPVTSLDVGATSLALAGLPEVPELDGENLIPHLTGEKPGVPHQQLFWRFWSQTATRKGKWKFLQAGDDLKYLFDLESPEHEKKNLIKEHPEVATELEASIHTWVKELKNKNVPAQPSNGGEKSFYGHYFPEKSPSPNP